jgi:hypothetical protein
MIYDLKESGGESPAAIEDENDGSRRHPPCQSSIGNHKS